MTELPEVIKYYRLLQTQLQHEKETIDALISSEQRYTRGILFEEAVRCLLRKMLPRNIAVAQGFIYDSGAKSKQCDIILYNSARYAPLLSVNDLVVLPVEAAISVIEVKTFLDKDQLGKALECFQSIDSICETALGYIPVKNYVLSSDSIKLRTLLRSDSLSSSPRYINAIFVLTKGFLLKQNQAPNALEAYSSEDVLFVLIAHVLNQYYFSTGIVGATHNPYEKYIEDASGVKIE